MNDATQPTSEVLALGDANASLLPGNLITAEGRYGEVIAIGATRAPMTLRLSEGTGEVRSVVVSHPDETSLRDAVLSLQQGITRSSTSIQYASSRHSQVGAVAVELGFVASGRYGAFSAKFAASFARARTQRREVFTVMLKQPMFTLAAETGSLVRNSDLLEASTRSAELQQLCAQGRLDASNPPMLIRTVTYGRLILMTFVNQSQMSEEAWFAALSAGYNGLMGSGSIEGEARRRFIEAAESSEVRLVAYGGSESSAWDAIRSGNVTPFFATQDPRTAVPISYSMLELSGSRPTVQFGRAYEYAEDHCCRTDCELPPRERRVTVDETFVIRGGAFGRSENRLYGERCPAGFERTESACDRRDSRFGHCAFLHWATEDPADCRAWFHFGVPATKHPTFQVRITGAETDASRRERGDEECRADCTLACGT